ncbi:MAG TPA: glycogen debranching enzyme, partial [Brachybacterium sp.]|nr:glycogen debranching enzyme [Brachybacterium sp.]
ESHNRSWNSGAEGPTEDREIQELRLRRMKNLMATLLLSQGVPMILHGDEMGRTQDGNNNTYCQDNELSWVDWELDQHQMEMLWFTQAVIALRRDHPIFRRRRFLQGITHDGVDSDLPDVEWLGTDGALMTDSAWEDAQNKCLTMFLNGSGIPEPNLRGERIVDDSALVLFNASGNPVDFTLPPADHGRTWRVELGTGDTIDVGDVLEAGTTFSRPGHSLLILMRPPMPDDGQDRPAPEGPRTARA